MKPQKIDFARLEPNPNSEITGPVTEPPLTPPVQASTSPDAASRSGQSSESTPVKKPSPLSAPSLMGRCFQALSGLLQRARTQVSSATAALWSAAIYILGFRRSEGTELAHAAQMGADIGAERPGPGDKTVSSPSDGQKTLEVARGNTGYLAADLISQGESARQMLEERIVALKAYHPIFHLLAGMAEDKRLHGVITESLIGLDIPDDLQLLAKTAAGLNAIREVAAVGSIDCVQLTGMAAIGERLDEALDSYFQQFANKNSLSIEPEIQTSWRAEKLSLPRNDNQMLWTNYVTARVEQAVKADNPGAKSFLQEGGMAIATWTRGKLSGQEGAPTRLTYALAPLPLSEKNQVAFPGSTRATPLTIPDAGRLDWTAFTDAALTKLYLKTPQMARQQIRNLTVDTIKTDAPEQALLVCSRIVELTRNFTIAPENWHSSPLVRWLCAGISPKFQSNACLGPLMRLSHACGLDFDKVILNSVEDNQASNNLTHIVSQAQASGMKAAFALFTSTAVSSDSKRIDALLKLTHPAMGIDVRNIVDHLQSQPVDRPIEWCNLDRNDQKRLLDCLAEEQHIGSTIILMDHLVANVDSSSLTMKFNAQGYDEACISKWMLFRNDFSNLEKSCRAFVLADVRQTPSRYATLLPRMDLVMQFPCTADALCAVKSRSAGLSSTDWANLAISWAENRNVLEPHMLLEYLQDLIEANIFSLPDIATPLFLRPEVAHSLFTLAKSMLLKAPAVAEMRILGKFAIAAACQRDIRKVQDVLALRAKQEMHGRLTLGACDAQGIDAFGNKVVYAQSKRVVHVAGITFTVAATSDLIPPHAPPKAADAELVMTPTTEQNLRRLALGWRQRCPIILEGGMSAGKTSLIRYLAYKSGLSFRRINLSPETDIGDLIGRFVLGTPIPTRAVLEEQSDETLRKMAEDIGLNQKSERRAIIDALLAQPKGPRWIDGPVVKAIRRGEILLLDEANLAPTEVLERLNSLFDDDNTLIIHENNNAAIKAHDNFRCFAAINPTGYQGRQKMSVAMRSRWTSLQCVELGLADLTIIMNEKYSETIPSLLRSALLEVHQYLIETKIHLTRSASESTPPTLRTIQRICNRFIALRNREGGLDDTNLMARELFEVYGASFASEFERRKVAEVIAKALPNSRPFDYETLSIEPIPKGVRLGDIELVAQGPKNALVPGVEAQLSWTPRTRAVVYQIAKALLCGEHVALVGERASGKTAMARLCAHLWQQPYFRLNLTPETESGEIVGSLGVAGWQDGPLLQAARPDGQGGILLLDEMNFANSAVLERLNGVLDGEGAIVISEHLGQRIAVHEKFKFIAAMNPSTGSYGGRRALSAALRSRLTFIAVQSPSIDEEIQMACDYAKTLFLDAAFIEPLFVHHKKEVFKQSSTDHVDTAVLSIRTLFRAVHTVADLRNLFAMPEAIEQALALHYPVSQKSHKGPH